MTKAEKEFQLDVRAIGCIACLVSLGVRSDGDMHHILRGNRRAGERMVLCLCPSHHRSGLDNDVVTSRHPWRTKFEKRYGSEAELLALTKAIVEDRRRMAS